MEIEKEKSLSWEKEEKISREEIKETKVSILWYFLPILFGFLGGLIGWALLRNQSPKKAVNILLIGIFVTGVLILFQINN